MSWISTLGPLEPEQWDRVQQIACKFESACSHSATVTLEEFLLPPGDALRLAVLLELIKIDLEFHWRGGRPIYIEDYLTQYPELETASGLLAVLLCKEFEVRGQYSTKPPLDTYRKRFPSHFDELYKLLPEKQTVRTDLSAVQAARSGPLNTPGPSIFPQDNQVLSANGGYRLHHRIGKGGYGEVWKAEAPGGIEVAVKIISRPQELEEVERELQALELIKRLRHPCLIQTQAYWVHEDAIYVIMELADGSLRDRLKQSLLSGAAALALPELLRCLGDVVEGLEYLHAQTIPVLHRDIKPENILLLQGHAKLADFGLARTGDAQVALFTMTGCGTPAYMAPEVWQGKAGKQTDQYSLAATYVELRLARPLFQADNLAMLMQMHLTQPPDLGPLPAAEQRVLRKALAKVPGERYPSCGAFHEALTRAVTPAGAPGPPAPTPASPWSRRTLAATGGLLLAVLVWFFMTPPLVLPAGCQAEADSALVTTQGRRYYQHLAVVLEDGTRIPFVLIPKRQGTNDPDTFYIMRDKVSVGLFRKFFAARPDEVEDKDRLWERPDYAIKDDLPVLGVYVEDAHRFARWLRGFLPTVQQWDKAAGRFEGDDREGPYEADADLSSQTDLAIGRGRRAGPLPLGKALKDRGPFGCRDMAGNGCEWTRSLNSGQLVPQPGAWGDVLLRSRCFDSELPFKFSMLDETRPESRVEARPYRETDYGIGFRVVLEP